MKEYGEYRWDEIEKMKGRVVILPVGGIEGHGRHLPLETDSLIPYEIARRVAMETGALVLPPINYGYTWTLRIFPGTISLRSSTLYVIIRDVVEELVRNGFKKILILNGHGGNAAIIKSALKELSDSLDFVACVVDWWKLGVVEEVFGGEAGHADVSEASVYAFFKPELALKNPKQEKEKKYVGSVIPLPRGVFTKSGYMGSVKGISAKRGGKAVHGIVRRLVKLVKKGLLLEEGK